jgi:opacity protein-like surface antigen
MRRFIGPAAVVALMAAPVAATAQDYSDSQSFGAAGYDRAPGGNWYVEFRSALSLSPDLDAGGDVDGDVALDPGFGGGGAIGYKILDQLRLEAELSVDVANVDEAEPVTAEAQAAAQRGEDPSGGGDVLTVGGFVNTAYDFNTGTAFRPFVAVGAGFVRVDGEIDAFALNDRKFSPAYQARLGVAWNVTRRTGLTLGYRFRNTLDDPELEGDSGTVDLDYQAHTFELGLRFQF